MGNGMRDTAEPEEQDRQRGRGITRSFARDRSGGPASYQLSGSRENARHGQGPTEAGGLLAVTGLELKGLDDLANPPSSDEMTAEKQRDRVEASV